MWGPAGSKESVMEYEYRYDVAWEPDFDKPAKRKVHYRHHVHEGEYAFVIDFGDHVYVATEESKPLTNAKAWARNHHSVVTVYALSGSGVNLFSRKMVTVKQRTS
jgi:hypothetical protein